MRWSDAGRLFATAAICLSVLVLRAQAQANLPGPAASPLPSTSAPIPSPFFVVLDAAHGGPDTGAHLGAGLEEKDLALSLALRLRAALAAQGVTVLMTREVDAALPPVARAEIANRRRAAACLSLHATASGSGAHLFTSSLSPAPPVGASQPLPWEAAQAPFIAQSLKLSSEIDSAMTHAEIPVTLGSTALQPLDNFTCPAVAVEIAPLTKGGNVVTPLADGGYQQRVVGALAAALLAWRRDWSVQP